MSDLEKNKAVVREFIAALGRLDVQRCLGLLTEDVMFETPGQFAAAGIKTKAEVTQEFGALHELLPFGIEYTIHTMTAEEDRVHVEWSGKAKTCDGGDYNNRYHYATVIRGDKICSFRDYLDSDLVVRVMVPILEKYGAVNFGRTDESA